MVKDFLFNNALRIVSRGKAPKRLYTAVLYVVFAIGEFLIMRVLLRRRGFPLRRK